MGLFRFLRSVYDVSTLDTRFTTPSSVPYRTVVESKHDPLAKDYTAGVKAKAQPSKWRSPEFFVYFLVFMIVIPMMIWIPFSVSRSSHPQWYKYRTVLEKGWVPGRQIDNSDMQYRTFRKNLPFMALLLIFHPLLRKVWNFVFPAKANKYEGNNITAQGAARLNQRASFDFVFALAFLVALHGYSAIKVLVILTANYQLTTSLPRKYVPFATWIFNVGILFANELCGGYPFKKIAAMITPPSGDTDLGAVDPFLVQWGAWLDRRSGLLTRWEVLFNITILRLISFNLDRYWSLDAGQSSPIENRANTQKKKQLDPSNLSERDRVSIPAEPQDYSFRNYLAYAIYGPLYLAGPILTFNEYISQSKYRSATIDTARTIRYGFRFLVVLLTMELILHFIYVGAINLAYPNWNDYTAAELSLLSYFNLMIIWLKLLLPWRLFRLWSLIDGIDPPENMVRCVSNNFSTLHFWRAWHRSYNRWLIRYIYVPLGGAKFTSLKSAVRSIVTYILVFTFVALWHDIQLRLLIWGWLIVLFLLPEIIASKLFPASKFEGRETTYRMLCCVGGVINVVMMMAANLVGFAVGLDGLKSIISGIFQDRHGLMFFSTACVSLFVGIQVMFEIRESEKRKGVNLRC
ncbi:hypothetical protein jhhlp_000985 [Lomentospora prolificans]|uniref:Uncharacterized protein n=1 Tax=Lomentospora prolificans TaxID=41688 RepID=A0A2N3NK31_9PEZI|nr:hypothetical protein jhhlp_000985 [Lomentospora prolificans]